MTATWIADIALAVMIVEIIVVVAISQRQGKTKLPADLLLNIASGACLLLALRASLTGADTVWLAALVGLAGLAHAASLAAR